MLLRGLCQQARKSTQLQHHRQLQGNKAGAGLLNTRSCLQSENRFRLELPPPNTPLRHCNGSQHLRKAPRGLGAVCTLLSTRQMMPAHCKDCRVLPAAGRATLTLLMKVACEHQEAEGAMLARAAQRGRKRPGDLQGLTHQAACTAFLDLTKLPAS